MPRQLPGSIVNSLRVLVASVLLTGVITLLTWVQADEVILAWSEGNSTAQEILASGGIDALRDNPIVPGFVQVAVVSFIGFVMLVWVLAAFLVAGHRWARATLTGTVGVGVLVTAVTLDNHLPAAFVVLAVLTVVLDVVLLFFLWHKDTTAYLRAH